MAVPEGEEGGQVMFEWEEQDRFSFEDSDRFEEVALTFSFSSSFLVTTSSLFLTEAITMDFGHFSLPPASTDTKGGLFKTI